MLSLAAIAKIEKLHEKDVSEEEESKVEVADKSGNAIYNQLSQLGQLL